MRSKVFISVVIVIVASALGIWGVNITNQKEVYTEIQLANIEALSATEGSEEGTPVGKCVMSAPSANETGWFYMCNDRTSNNMIYPCPNTTQFGWKAYETMCTK